MLNFGWIDLSLFYFSMAILWTLRLSPAEASVFVRPLSPPFRCSPRAKGQVTVEIKSRTARGCFSVRYDPNYDYYFLNLKKCQHWIVTVDVWCVSSLVHVRIDYYDVHHRSGRFGTLIIVSSGVWLK